MRPAILTDTTKCIGCRECVAACKKSNRTGLRSAAAMGHAGRPVGAQLDINCRRAEARIRAQTVPALPGARLRIRLPVGALHRTELGPVVYDSSKCIGCRYCMMACPYGIPRYDWDQAVPYVRKCNLCYDRLQAGSSPHAPRPARRKRRYSEIEMRCSRKRASASRRSPANTSTIFGEHAT